MKEILLITEHPAPYWDKSLLEISQHANVSVIYIKERVDSKPWNDQKYFPGIFFNIKNLFLIIQLIYSSNQIILGGIYLPQLRLLLLVSLFMLKKVALFSDVPKVYSRSLFLVYFKRCFYKFFNLFLISGQMGIDFYHNSYNIRRNKLIYFPYAWEEGKIIPTDFSLKPLKIFISNRFLERKGYDILLKAIKILEQKQFLNQFVFVIAGSGILKEKYKLEFYQIKELNVKFLDWISHSNYIHEINNCHIFIHTSKFEPFGVPVLDALYRGKIVIASNGVMSAHDFIKNKKNGFLFQKENELQLANILENLIKGVYDLNEISFNARNTLKSYSFYIQKFINKVVI
jgi:glycosyltransferase involved in cell wall biosynthesis